VQYKALYDYVSDDPSRDDILEIKTGDMIAIVEKDSDAWCVLIEELRVIRTNDRVSLCVAAASCNSIALQSWGRPAHT
jgi:SH3 domain-containing protein